MYNSDYQHKNPVYSIRLPVDDVLYIDKMSDKGIHFPTFVRSLIRAVRLMDHDTIALFRKFLPTTTDELLKYNDYFIHNDKQREVRRILIHESFKIKP